MEGVQNGLALVAVEGLVSAYKCNIASSSSPTPLTAPASLLCCSFCPHQLILPWSFWAHMPISHKHSQEAKLPSANC